MGVFLVVTHGRASLDLYSIKLSAYLRVPALHTDIYQRVRGFFHKPLLSPSTVNELHLILSFSKKLNGLDGIPHLPNHHLGRVGYLLRKPFIITVHDLIRYFDAMGYGPLIHRPNLKDRMLLSLDYEGVKRAAKVIVPSNRVKLDLVRFLGVAEEKIRVIYHGVDEVFKPRRGWRPLQEPYILYVGSEHPRKNLVTLLRAFKQLKQEYPELKQLKLVKIGSAGGGEADFRAETLRVINACGIEKDVIFIDWVSPEKLAYFYSNAEVFAFPSLYEGFGWPPLEAMACGCPVVASNASSLPEILGDAALYASPRDVQRWKQLLAKILTDKNLRIKLVQKGLQRARRYTWEEAAKQTLKVYREVEEEMGYVLT